MFRHDKERHAEHTHHLHIGASLKKAAKWYLDQAAQSYMWPSKPFDYRNK